MRASSVAAPPGALRGPRTGPPPLLPSQALRRPLAWRPDPRAVVGAVFLGAGPARDGRRSGAASPQASRCWSPRARWPPGSGSGRRTWPSPGCASPTASWRQRGCPPPSASGWWGRRSPRRCRRASRWCGSSWGASRSLGPDRVAFAVPVGPDTAAGGQLRPGRHGGGLRHLGPGPGRVAGAGAGAAAAPWRCTRWGTGRRAPSWARAGAGGAASGGGRSRPGRGGPAAPPRGSSSLCPASRRRRWRRRAGTASSTSPWCRPGCRRARAAQAVPAGSGG